MYIGSTWILCCSSIFPLLLIPLRGDLLNLILILVEVGRSPGEDADANETNGDGGEGGGGGLHHLRGHHLAQPPAQPEHRYVVRWEERRMEKTSPGATISKGAAYERRSKSKAKERTKTDLLHIGFLLLVVLLLLIIETRVVTLPLGPGVTLAANSTLLTILRK